MGITTMLRSATMSEGMEAALSVTTVTVFKEAASAEGRFLLAGQRAGGAGRVTRRGGARPRGPSGDTAGRGPLRGRTRPASGTRESSTGSLGLRAGGLGVGLGTGLGQLLGAPGDEPGAAEHDQARRGQD